MLKLESISTADVRPEILRSYYEQSYGKKTPTETAFGDATFEEYYALQRVRFPGISPRTAAANTPRFRELAARFSDDPPREQELPNLYIVQRRNEIDLDAEAIGPETQSIVIDRVKKLTGLGALQKPKKLLHAQFILCGGPRVTDIKRRALVEELHVAGCELSLTMSILFAANARKLQIEHEATPVFDLVGAKHHSRLVQLRVFAGLVRGVENIANLPIETLYLSNVEVNSSLSSTLTRLKESLRDLGFGNQKSFGPSELPSLPQLRRLTIPGYAEYRTQWIEYALKHRQCGFYFPPVEIPAKLPKVALAKLYRDVDILTVERGKKVVFEVSGDLAGRFLPGNGDNGVLEDRLRPLATKAKKKIMWSSESDTFVAQTTKLEDAMWVIDRLEELRP